MKQNVKLWYNLPCFDKIEMTIILVIVTIVFILILIVSIKMNKTQSKKISTNFFSSSDFLTSG